MKIYLLLLFAITNINSCNNTNEFELFEGEIYITLINVYNPKILVAENRLNELRNTIVNYDPNGKSQSETEITAYYQTLIDNNLFDKSTFQVKLKNESIINVYVDDDKYVELQRKIYNLSRDKEKILIVFEGKKISDGINNRAIYSATNINSIIKTAGKTDGQK